MSIVQHPDSLSLSGNLKDIKVASSTQVSFVLKQDNDVVLSQTYDPGNDGLISISLKNIIAGRLSFLLQETANVFEQPNLAADFTAEIDNESITFRVIRAGVDRLADTATNFLKGNFLTWQPQTKHVTYSTPEFLTYYAVVPGTIRLKAYFTDDTGAVVSNQTLDLSKLEAGKAYTVPLQYATVAAKFGAKLPAFYDIWVENESSERITYIQRYVASGLKSYQEQWILFENSLGGLDTFRAYGATDFTSEHTHNIANIEDEAYEYRIDTERKHAKNTGHLDSSERRWLLDFFPSAAKYIYTDNYMRRIVVTDSNVTYTDKELPSNYTFTYKYADSKPFLNLPRSEVAPGDDLNIVIPDLGSFTVPPRLAELPRLVLTEGALFPVQSPYSEEWRTTTMGAIFEYVSERFTGDGSGGANTGVLDERYLRKDMDDTAAGNISFVKSARSALYLEGLDGHGWKINNTGGALLDDLQVRKDISIGGILSAAIYLEGMTGAGWGIDSTGAAMLDDLRVRENIYLGGKFGSVAYASGFSGFGIEIDAEEASETLDYLTVRKTMQVYELVYSQVYGLGGSVIISDLNKIASVELLSDNETFRCVIDTMDDTMRMNLRAGDIVRMQRSNGINVRYFYGQVTAITPDHFDMKVIDGVDAPEVGDVVFRFGSTTDASRQGIIYLTSSDDHAPYIDIVDGITDASLVNKTKARLGNLSGIRTQSGVNLSGYGLYAQGAVFENSEIYLADGNKIEQWFSVYDGKLESAISSVLDDMSGQEGNILRNSSFYKNLYYWTSDNLVNFIELGDLHLWIDTFYVEKQNIADIYYDGTRNVLRIKNTILWQTNDLFLGHPLSEGAHSLTFYYKVLKAGTLTFGFDDEDLYRSDELSVTPNYQKCHVEEIWDGTGDFQIGFTGEILIYGLTLRSDALSDAIVRMETLIEQTQESIKLLATKDYVDSETGDIYERYDAELLITAQQISAAANRITALETASAGWVTTADGNLLWANKAIVDSMGNTILAQQSQISQMSDSITLVVREVSGIEQDLATHESRINLLSDSIELAVSELDDLTGNELVSRINMDSTSVAIQAEKIKLEGAITANGNVFINTDGTIVANGGIFNGFIQFPFKWIAESDAIPLSSIRYKLNKDMNLMGQGLTFVLPNDASYNGAVVNIFNNVFPPWTYASMAAFVDVEREDGGKIYEVTYTQAQNYDAPTSILVAGNLFQFLCVVHNNQVDWCCINRTAQ